MISRAFFSLLLTVFSVSVMAQSHTKYVDPFIGNDDNGHTFPGACVPFGMVQTSPVSGAVGWNYCAEYIYRDKEIWGFTQTHLNGTGCMDLGDILIMPSTARKNRINYHSAINKETETAKPGYYSVYLDDVKAKAELTATEHVAYHRYTFDSADSAAVYLDLQHGPAWKEEEYHSHVISCEFNWDSARQVSGHVRNKVWVDQDIYFVICFDHDMKYIKDLPLMSTERGRKMVIGFDINKGEAVETKIAISSASVDGALRNLKAEIPEWDFAAKVKDADSLWESYLSRIEVEGSEDELKSFYTSFYHALIQPNNIADVDGTYRREDGTLAKAENNAYFSTFSCWDTYRAAHPFYSIMVPSKVGPMISSMITQAEQFGFLPIWGLWGKDNYCMVANHAVPIVAEAYHKGIKGFDAERAFQAIKNSQTKSHALKSDWETYMKYGYFPYDLIKTESVSSTLESVYDDYAAADMARLMGKKEDEEYFTRRAGFYKNLFDPETKFMRPRKSDGTWRTPFDPSSLAHATSIGGDYTEGNAWQYTWHVQHDIPELIEMIGGKKAFTKKLDEFFTLHLESNVGDVTGLIGQYAHGNEPSHHVAYLYTMAGKPERTQELVREIFDTKYTPKTDGLCGNDDCGQMSAWYMLSAMGFYPVDPVSAKYIFGAPQMKRIVLHLENGKTFEVEARNISRKNLHVGKIYLNGKVYKENYIDHETIMNGGKLVFEMKR